MKNSRWIAMTAVVAGSLLAGTVYAGVVTIPSASIPRGWYKVNGTNNGASAGNNTFVGMDNGTPKIELRNWFRFSMAPVTGLVVSADFILGDVLRSFSDPTETYVIGSVTTAPSQLGLSASIPVFQDLKAGTAFGSMIVTNGAAQFGVNRRIPFNAAGVLALNAVAGGDFAIGGYISSLSGQTTVDEGLYFQNVSVELTITNFPPTILESWEFAGNAGNESTVPATFASAEMQPAPVSRGPGLQAFSGAGGFFATDWTTLGVLDLDDYIEVPVTPVPGYKYSVTGMTFKITTLGEIGTGPQNWVLRSSADTFMGNIATWSSGLSAHTRNVTVPGMVNMTSTTVFRLYGYVNIVNSPGNPGLNSALIPPVSSGGLSGSGDDVVVYGSAIFDAPGDADNDGMPNDWELLHSGSATGLTASADDDGDGMINGDEFTADTDPTDSNSFHRITVFFPVSQAASILPGSIPCGWYNASGANNGRSAYNNTYCGIAGGTTVEYRNWFAFSMAGYSGTVVSADMVMTDVLQSFSDPTETYVIGSVTSTPSQLGLSPSIPVFQDLKAGTPFGSMIVTNGAASFGVNRRIPFNAAGLAALSAAMGGDFAMGGHVGSLSGQTTADEGVYFQTVSLALTIRRAAAPKNPDIVFPSSIQRVYSLQYSDDLKQPVWTPVPGQTNVPGAGGTNILIDTSPATHRMYRVTVGRP